MIARTAPSDASASSWQRSYADAVSSVGELLGLLGLSSDDLPEALRGEIGFPLRVPRGFVDRMRPGDPRDPLLLQVLPTRSELEAAPGFCADPVGDGAASPVPGVLHKYRGRALLVVTGACAIHCRYCFRREFPYGPHAAALPEAVEWVRDTPEIEETILSGGDPLSLSNGRLEGLLDALDAIPHVRRLRIHTRLPIVLPERVDDGLVRILGERRAEVVVVVHANHAREIDATVSSALRRLRLPRVTLLNQAVLLRGVNDSVSALADLSLAVFSAGVLPYYLHLLDRVSGTAAFEVPESEARELLWLLARRSPGYLVPRLVREVAGAPAKVPIAWGPGGP